MQCKSEHLAYFLKNPTFDFKTKFLGSDIKSRIFGTTFSVTICQEKKQELLLILSQR
jgi:hypothetical protein